MDDVEFRLGRGFRTRPLALGGVALILAAALYAAGLHMPALQWLAVFPLAYAAGSLAVYAWRGHLSTRLTARGIEIRRYRRRLVPWQAIRDIETISYDQVAQYQDPEREFASRPGSADGGSGADRAHRRPALGVSLYRRCLSAAMVGRCAGAGTAA